MDYHRIRYPPDLGVLARVFAENCSFDVVAAVAVTIVIVVAAAGTPAAVDTEIVVIIIDSTFVR